MPKASPPTSPSHAAGKFNQLVRSVHVYGILNESFSLFAPGLSALQQGVSASLNTPSGRRYTLRGRPDQQLAASEVNAALQGLELPSRHGDDSIFALSKCAQYLACSAGRWKKRARGGDSRSPNRRNRSMQDTRSTRLDTSIDALTPLTHTPPGQRSYVRRPKTSCDSRMFTNLYSSEARLPQSGAAAM